MTNKKIFKQTRMQIHNLSARQLLIASIAFHIFLEGKKRMTNKAINGKSNQIILISKDVNFSPALAIVKALNKDVLIASITKRFSNELRQKFPHKILKKGGTK